jgi:hypothetical protein
MTGTGSESPHATDSGLSSRRPWFRITSLIQAQIDGVAAVDRLANPTRLRERSSGSEAGSRDQFPKMRELILVTHRDADLPALLVTASAGRPLLEIRDTNVTVIRKPLT